jgi:hypothetical protein
VVGNVQPCCTQQVGLGRHPKGGNITFSNMLRFKRMTKQQPATTTTTTTATTPPTTTTIYEFKDSSAPLGGNSEARKARGRSGDDEDGATAGSLSYSAATSHSSRSSSMASNDSSFAEFRRVLEGDSKELATFLKEHVRRGGGGGGGRDEKSVAADSLAYSTDADTLHGRSYGTDADSHLQGSTLVSNGTTT